MTTESASDANDAAPNYVWTRHGISSLWITDAEMVRRMGAPEKIARQAIRALDQNPRSGFPKKQALWGGRRYWPAVKVWLDRNNGLST